jgi:hypothetical protein
MSTALASYTPPAPVVVSWTVPISDLATLTSLPEVRRVEVQHTLRLLERMHQLVNERGVRGAAAMVVATSGHMRGLSTASLVRKYYAVRAHGWCALIKDYKGPSSQPPEFITFVRRLAEDNHRSMAEAFELLRLEIWPSGQPVPGYGTWMEYYSKQHPERPLPRAFPRIYPPGWSERNLLRLAPSKGARTLYQRGIAAAKKYFPSVKRDPSQLRPLELITIDDFELDCLCFFSGDSANKPQLGRVAGLLAIDVATRRKLHWGLGQRLERIEEQPDGTTRTVRTGISRVDVQILLQGLFAKHGLPDYPVTILCENASASISPELELCLNTLFEGRIRIERTGLINHKTLTNGFGEKGGKPWEKGWIESTFNALWNKLGALPGYKGSNQRLNGPANLDAAISYTKLLIGQGERALNLPPEKLALLRLPFPSLATLEQAFAWACAALDARTEHKYIGFDRVTEFALREGDEPRPFHDLALVPYDQQQNVIVSERMESPLERWSRLGQLHPCTPLPASVLALLLLTPKRVTYRNHQITFAHGKTGYTYLDAKGDVVASLADGTELLGHFDPAAPELLHIADLRGAYLGSLTRLGGSRGMIDIRDKAALSEAAGQIATVRNRTLSEIRERHADQDAQLAADRAHNDALVAEHKAATASLSTAEKIGLAAGHAAEVQHRRKTQEKALRKIASSDELSEPTTASPSAGPGNYADDLL